MHEDKNAQIWRKLIGIATYVLENASHEQSYCLMRNDDGEKEGIFGVKYVEKGPT